MLVAAMVLGIVGAAIGIVGAVVILVSSVYESWMPILAIIFSFIGAFGGVLTPRKPRAAGLLMITAAAGGYLCIFWFFAPAFVLMIVGGVYALIASCDIPRRA